SAGEDCDVERLDPKKTDPEYFEFECLTVEEVEKLLNESVEKLNTILQITPSLAKVLLLEHQWMNQVVVDKYRQNANLYSKWLTKCADDSETANYISANTKDCPKCHICIEKNGGCNHMQCFNCKYDFCWMCLGDWKTHGSEYYECSRYKDNPNIANESVHVQAREA
ncbi:hypothetical protein DOY81_015630, partial [Sarcophaga bullata]